MKTAVPRVLLAFFLVVMSVAGLLVPVQPVLAGNGNSSHSVKSFTLQDTDPSSFVFKGGIGNGHQVNQPFPVYVFITNKGQAGKPLVLSYDVPVTVKLQGAGNTVQSYTATILKGQKYATVNVTCPSDGVWSLSVQGQLDGVPVNAGPWVFYVGADKGIILSVQPAGAMMSPGDTKQFQAFLVFSNWQPVEITNWCSWDSDNTRVATVSPGSFLGLFAAPGGLVTAQKNGTATITATIPLLWQLFLKTVGLILEKFAGIPFISDTSASAVVTVYTPDQAKLMITPKDPQVALDDTINLAALLVYPDNTTKEITGDANLKWQSSNPGIATVGSGTDSGVVNGVGIGTAKITATYTMESDKNKPQTLTDNTTVTVFKADFQIVPQNPTIAVGGKVQLQAQLIYPDSTEPTLVSSNLAWSTDNSEVVSINGYTGEVTGIKPGTATVYANYHNGDYQAATKVTVQDNSYLQILPQDPIVPLNGTIQLQAQLVNPDTNTTTDVTQQATWSTDETGGATMVSGSPGLFKGIIPGSTTVIYAAYNGQSASVNLTVPQAALAVTVDTSKSRINTGVPVQFHAYYTDGIHPSVDVTQSAKWDASGLNSCFAGKLTAVEEGPVTVTASYNGLKAQSGIYAVQPKLTVSTSTGRTTLNVGSAPVSLTATYSDADVLNQDVTKQMTWTSGNPSVISVSAGTVQAVAAGTNVPITGEYTNTYNQKIDANITLSAVQPQLTVTSPQTNVNVGSTLNLKATLTDAFGSEQDVTGQSTWSSSDPGILTVSAQGTVKAVKAGSATVTATYMTQDGATVSQNVSITAVQPQVTISPGTLSMNAGDTSATKLVATYSGADGTKDVSASVVWTSSDPSIATVGTPSADGVQVTGIAAGTATITATYNGVPGCIPGSATVTVNAINLQSGKLVIQPYTTAADVNGTVQFNAYWQDENGTQFRVTDNADWSSSDGKTVAVNNTDQKGLVTVTAGSPQPQPVTITAVYHGITANAFLKIGKGVFYEYEPQPGN